MNKKLPTTISIFIPKVSVEKCRDSTVEDRFFLIIFIALNTVKSLNSVLSVPTQKINRRPPQFFFDPSWFHYLFIYYLKL